MAPRGIERAPLCLLYPLDNGQLLPFGGASSRCFWFNEVTIQPAFCEKTNKTANRKVQQIIKLPIRFVSKNLHIFVQLVAEILQLYLDFFRAHIESINLRSDYGDILTRYQ